MKSQRSTRHPRAPERRHRPAEARAPAAAVRHKNRFTPEELERFRQALVTKWHEFQGDADSLRHEASAGGGQVTSMPENLADLASDTWEQELTYSLIENRQLLLREIEDALQRIKDGTYGICEANGKPIAKTRLSAIPWVKYCIECALRHEARSASPERPQEPPGRERSRERSSSWQENHERPRINRHAIR
jgi:DnaK suppressor protein